MSNPAAVHYSQSDPLLLATRVKAAPVHTGRGSKTVVLICQWSGLNILDPVVMLLSAAAQQLHQSLHKGMRFHVLVKVYPSARQSDNLRMTVSACAGLDNVRRGKRNEESERA